MSRGPLSMMPCSECGATLPKTVLDEHACDPQRRADFQLARLRPRVERFDADLAAWLDTPRGRFEQWDARRQRAA